MKTLPKSPLLVLALVLGGCASAPSGPPEEVAGRILTSLDADRPGEARASFERVADDRAYRREVYAILYSSAGERYASGDPEGAATLLRFLAEAYPDAPAVREALVYSLFLVRSRSEHATPESNRELEHWARELGEVPGARSPWLDLVDAQLAVDGDDPAGAREALTRFLESWNGEPAALLPYVEDLGRFASSPVPPGGGVGS